VLAKAGVTAEPKTSTSSSPRREGAEGRLHRDRARRPALAGSDDLRQRRAVDRRLDYYRKAFIELDPKALTRRPR
jgi:hypothetical protein